MKSFRGLTPDSVFKEEQPKTRTYRQYETKIEGYVDGLEALKQAICKILYTERFAFPVYSFSYGMELQKLIGKEQIYVKAELRRMIREALLNDDRIQDVSGFEFRFDGDVCRCSFLVNSIYGKTISEMEVMV